MLSVKGIKASTITIYSIFLSCSLCSQLVSQPASQPASPCSNSRSCSSGIKEAVAVLDTVLTYVHTYVRVVRIAGALKSRLLWYQKREIEADQPARHAAVTIDPYLSCN